MSLIQKTCSSQILLIYFLDGKYSQQPIMLWWIQLFSEGHKGHIYFKRDVIRSQIEVCLLCQPISWSYCDIWLCSSFSVLYIIWTKFWCTLSRTCVKYFLHSIIVPNKFKVHHELTVTFIRTSLHQLYIKFIHRTSMTSIHSSRSVCCPGVRSVAWTFMSARCVSLLNEPFAAHNSTHLLQEG